MKKDCSWTWNRWIKLECLLLQFTCFCVDLFNILMSSVPLYLTEKNKTSSYSKACDISFVFDYPLNENYWSDWKGKRERLFYVCKVTLCYYFALEQDTMWELHFNVTYWGLIAVFREMFWKKSMFCKRWRKDKGEDWQKGKIQRNSVTESLPRLDASQRL